MAGFFESKESGEERYDFIFASYSRDLKSRFFYELVSLIGIGHRKKNTMWQMRMERSYLRKGGARSL